MIRAHAAAGMLLALACLPARATETRPYSLSLEVRYGDEPSRASYLDEIRRSVSSWLNSTGPFDAPDQEGEADLHLRIIFHKIEVDWRYPAVTGEQPVLFDPAQAPAHTWSTLFVTEVALLDTRRGNERVAEKRLSVFNEQVQSDRVPDPRQYSWDENVEFLIDRLNSFLQQKRKRIQRYLQEHPRQAPP